MDVRFHDPPKTANNLRANRHERALEVVMKGIVFTKREFLWLCPPVVVHGKWNYVSRAGAGPHVAAIVRFRHPAW
jgi:hypothetical protein